MLQTTSRVKPNGERIRTLRGEHGMTVEALAKKAKCSEKTVYSAERGNLVYPSTLHGIAAALGVSYASLRADEIDESESLDLAERNPRSFARISVTFDVDREALSEFSHGSIDAEDLVELVYRKFLEAIHPKQQCFLVGYQFGSVVLQLAISAPDYEQLLILFATGNDTTTLPILRMSIPEPFLYGFGTPSIFIETEKGSPAFQRLQIELRYRKLILPRLPWWQRLRMWLARRTRRAR